ncbi:MAG: hypothetical protein K8I60_09780, partial [Anaerolineae bacterium]|nr:hypothetical protein [Anaerolineae bacterium]
HDVLRAPGQNSCLRLSLEVPIQAEQQQGNHPKGKKTTENMQRMDEQELFLIFCANDVPGRMRSTIPSTRARDFNGDAEFLFNKPFYQLFIAPQNPDKQDNERYKLDEIG